MKAEILYKPDGIVLDLSKHDLGHKDGYKIIEQHHRQSQRRNPEYNRSNPAFLCLRHLGDSNPGLFIKKIKGQFWAVHYQLGSCPTRVIAATMSDEHKRQAEYWARAAEAVGWRTETERSLATGTRPDVLIHGSVATGIEVQRSYMSISGAVMRTRRAAAAGVNDVWYSTSTTSPQWAWRVPTVLNRELGILGEGHSWDSLPRRRSITAAGLRLIREARCDHLNFNRCPYSRSHCGKFHPKPEVWRNVTVDDVAERFPAGEIVVLRFWGIRELGGRSREAEFLVPSDHKKLYEDLTDSSVRRLAHYSSIGETRRVRTQDGNLVDCSNSQSIEADTELDPYQLGPWRRCRKCNRSYRPANFIDMCYDCRFEKVIKSTY